LLWGCKFIKILKTTRIFIQGMSFCKMLAQKSRAEVGGQRADGGGLRMEDRG
jgi:hypothetical protein